MVSDAIAPWAEPVLLTAHDLEALPEDGWRYELVQGRLVRMPPTGFEHSRVVRRLDRALDRFVLYHDLGEVTTAETGFLVSPPYQPDTVLAPDIAFISKDRLPGGVNRGYLRLAPDLVVEIASPSQHHPEMAAKARLWIAAGTRLVWVVWPDERAVDIWGAGAEEPRLAADALEGEDVVPGFRFPLDELFAV